MSTSTVRVPLRFRPFAEGDYETIVAIRNQVDRDDPTTVADVRYSDSIWETDRFDRLRLMAEDETGRVVGFGQINHIPYEFHPQRYRIVGRVDPALWRRGIGTAIYERMLAELRSRNATAARAEIREDHTETVGFMQRRGFVERQREYESHFDVRSFDFGRFPDAEARVTAQGLALTTLAAEGADAPEVLRRLHDCFVECDTSVPSIDGVTPTSFERFLATDVRGPNALPDAYFLARDGDRYVGLSNLHRNPALPHVLDQQLTGVRADYRRRGIALALKLMGIRYARQHGKRLIRTGNDVRNQGMLAINEALGFVLQPAWLVMEKELTRAEG